MRSLKQNSKLEIDVTYNFGKFFFLRLNKLFSFFFRLEEFYKLGQETRVVVTVNYVNTRHCVFKVVAIIIPYKEK